MQRSWQTENKLAATQYPPCHTFVPCCGRDQDQVRLPYPDPKSTLAGHLWTSNRFDEKGPFPPCNAVDFSYRGRCAPSCAECLELPDQPAFANRFLHQTAAKRPASWRTSLHSQQTFSTSHPQPPARRGAPRQAPGDLRETLRCATRASPKTAPLTRVDNVLTAASEPNRPSTTPYVDATVSYCLQSDTSTSAGQTQETVLISS